MAHLQLSALGFEPLALTDCLNFASPEDPKTMGHFVAAVEALAKSSQDFATPVISGNVSFYNETVGQPITPTPAIGMVGLRAMTPVLPLSHFAKAGDKIYRLQNVQVQTTGLLAEVQGRQPEYTGNLDTAALARWGDQVRKLVLTGTVSASRVVSRFGWAYALARMTTSTLGCRVSGSARDDLFIENFYEVLVTGGAALKSALEKSGLEWVELGEVVPKVFEIERRISSTVDEIQQAYRAGFGENFGKLS
jgi:phosphoribosylformylglycinamidine synthase